MRPHEESKAAKFAELIEMAVDERCVFTRYHIPRAVLSYHPRFSFEIRLSRNSAAAVCSSSNVRLLCSVFAGDPGVLMDLDQIEKLELH